MPIANKAGPLYKRSLRTGPGMPLGDRVVVKPLPILAETASGLTIPDSGKERGYAGRLLLAGDEAAEKLYAKGVEIGDEVWYGKFAGVIETWERIVGKDNLSCPHDGAWDLVPKDDKQWSGIEGRDPSDSDQQLRACRACGTLRLSDRVIFIRGEDILVSVELLERLEAGVMSRKRGKNADGSLNYYIERAPERPDKYEYDNGKDGK